MSIVDTLKSALSSVRKDAAGITGTLEKIRAERAALEAERETLTSLPMARGDLEMHLFHLIDQIGGDYPRRLGAACAGITRRATRLTLDLADFPNRDFALIHATRDPGIAATPSDTQTGLAFLLAPLLKDGISRALSELDFSTAGAPAAERITRIDAIDKALHQLDQRESEIQSLLSDLRAASEPEL